MIRPKKLFNIKSNQGKKLSIANKTLHIDVNDERVIKGWAASNADLSLSVVVSITSSSDSVSIVANQHRPDVRRAGLHNTGFCGFQYDISNWADKEATVTVISVVNSRDVVDFSPVFFVHIPKTAGTSFKCAAQDYFGTEGIVRNYGLNSSETTPWIKDVVLLDKNIPKLYQRIKQEGIGLYTGHIAALPTANVFPIKDIVTFMRQPMVQVLSHYHHYVRWYGYEKPIEDFIKNPGFKNLQTRYLKGMPLQLIGFVGLTEKYTESVKLYNSYKGFNLEVREDNINSHHSADEISSELTSLIAEHNKADNRIYDLAAALLNDRLRLVHSGQEWCFCFIDNLDNKIVTGVAYMQLSNEPVSLVIKSNGLDIGHCIANCSRPGLVQFGVPNNGFIGFSFAIPETVNSNDISVEVESTGQVLQRKVII